MSRTLEAPAASNDKSLDIAVQSFAFAFSDTAVKTLGGEKAFRAENNTQAVEAGLLAKGKSDSTGISFDAFKAADASMDSMIAGKGKLMSGIVMESSANNKALG
ncbi:MAG: hypothetical protein K2W82_17905 [Candidatus Obscuribacterales bacterium]|nr:hypothetical protein [Candidatus Obscuribacterales bacterium]